MPEICPCHASQWALLNANFGTVVTGHRPCRTIRNGTVFVSDSTAQHQSFLVFLYVSKFLCCDSVHLQKKNYEDYGFLIQLIVVQFLILPTAVHTSGNDDHQSFQTQWCPNFLRKSFVPMAPHSHIGPHHQNLSYD